VLTLGYCRATAGATAGAGANDCRRRPSNIVGRLGLRRMLETTLSKTWRRSTSNHRRGSVTHIPATEVGRRYRHLPD
jgi:hypothetical protein